MFVDFFIKRPIFASVCAIVILLIGLISIPTLPIARFPEISPTQITVTSNYNGASAEIVESGVTNILERQINGVEGLRYLTSSSSNDGTSTITATFDSSRDKDIAAVDVQNRVSVAQPQLPDSVQRTGVRVSKESSNILLAIGLYAENKEYDNTFLSNYADLYLADALKRVKGVSNAQIFGERRYAMRLWLDPSRLANRGLTTQDVADALSEQNLQVGAGRIGQEPAPKGQRYQLDVRAASRLTEPAEFEEIVLKTGDDGTLVKLKDVGRAELGAENYSSFLRFRGNDAVGLGIYQVPGSNALDVAKGVKAELALLAPSFPPGLKYQVAFDTTSFVEESLAEVVKTLIEAVVLVVIVIFVFLQDWRTTLIPALTIPLALIGTFAFVKVFNFSINSLTLFGLTLASGMVVDDAIVVVEQISRFIQDKGISPRRAASESMAELSSAVIATSLVLMAVFVPVAFFPGTTGALYRQFALTIAFSIAISTFLALTLTPSLCALLLRQGQKPSGWLGWIFGQINRFLDWVQNGYKRSLTFLTRFQSVVIGLFIVSLGMTVWLYTTVPTAFLPDEDEGYFITIIQGPQGVSLQYTSDVIAQVEKEILQLPEVLGTFAIGGFGFSGSTANSGIIFTTLKSWDERSKPGQSVQAIIGSLQGKLLAIPEARVFPVNPPPIQGLGNFGGFVFQLQDRRGNSGLENLVQSMGKLLGQANQTPGLQAVFSTFAADTPQLLVEVDRNKAKSLQVSIDDIFNTLQTALGSQYVNDFNLQQRNYRVYIQADQQFRSNPKDISKLYVRSEKDQMIPLSNLVKVTQTVGAQTINHYNLFRSIEINGSAAPGSSSGDAIKAMEKVAKEVLPAGYGYEWSGTALEEIDSGGLAPLIFGLGIIFVFLVLAAQYENYVDPFIILLSVPLAIFGALIAQSMRGFANDVYCQIGLVMLIGLASKNAILIVEFANQLREQGLSITKAVIEASQERLRPILMTAFSTLLGIFPLAVATGAGAGSRQSLGTAVFGGMLIATFLSLFVVPILYIVIKTTTERFIKPNRHQELQTEGISLDGKSAAYSAKGEN
ncbi:hydrophobe/amphiphile efflux-1 family RND transporter [Nostoc sp. 'Peltigera membranacea cyanobiont' 213]|uniref:efflux RND transporter permease subunit n=1 Tax=Nostoc cyanobionts TaxID=3123326 RepID=UPI000B951955|nr:MULTISPECIES: efflux RND transporter permease subunit [unclassified Nostoc]AVH67058.1 acriflavin resistance protein [Nostoc sp. 'Peltigera membranacea cyanobiont' N6]OYD95919.1 hydrophobe/amphiphile efflux-1 family RND transporter [Nostoc sp. 'Peltigera membranacea cyanobiont' 213]